MCKKKNLYWEAILCSSTLPTRRMWWDSSDKGIYCLMKEKETHDRFIRMEWSLQWEGRDKVQECGGESKRQHEGEHGAAAWFHAFPCPRESVQSPWFRWAVPWPWPPGAWVKLFIDSCFICCGNPLQYSCLENPMDRGSWWTIIHGVAKS